MDKKENLLELENVEIDPLYNDKADEDDAQWVEKNLYKYLNVNRKSDAILNCPCCFTLLCLDCQRHETYYNQYRAMFVRNCKILSNKEIKYRKQANELSKKQKKKLLLQQKRNKKKDKLHENNTFLDPMDFDNISSNKKPFEYIDNIMVEDEDQFEKDIYFPVCCKFCDTEVGVIDKDEVYHFWNIIPSEP